MKKFWLQVHWLLGISAGLVLMVMGISGAVLSFEHELLRWMNPGVVTVSPRPEGLLPPYELVTRIQSVAPAKRIIGLQLSSDPTVAARVRFAASTVIPSERENSKTRVEVGDTPEQPGGTIRDGQRRPTRQRGG
ncbi:MAG: PepSY domain-containing protein, partial [Candidatus Binatia bacterium]